MNLNLPVVLGQSYRLSQYRSHLGLEGNFIVRITRSTGTYSKDQIKIDSKSKQIKQELA